MRIIGGTHRGLKLADVGAGDPSAHLRPTSDRVRETIFNLLINAHGDPVTGARVLDVFAGTGALGLEALSRGASSATFVDDGDWAQALIQANIGKMRVAPITRLFRQDATRLGPNPDAPYGLVFLDPPYRLGLGEMALSRLAGLGWIAAGATVVWEEGSIPVVPYGFVLRDQRRYGETVVTLLEAPE